ncbi:MAG: hypothetical protein HYU36_15795 [Planctomycetes bacterium]|nr:hypothetical protein [Planctomycetota bacterium]
MMLGRFGEARRGFATFAGCQPELRSEALGRFGEARRGFAYVRRVSA